MAGSFQKISPAPLKQNNSKRKNKSKEMLRLFVMMILLGNIETFEMGKLLKIVSSVNYLFCDPVECKGQNLWESPKRHSHQDVQSNSLHLIPVLLTFAGFLLFRKCSLGFLVFPHIKHVKATTQKEAITNWSSRNISAKVCAYSGTAYSKRLQMKPKIRYISIFSQPIIRYIFEKKKRKRKDSYAQKYKVFTLYKKIYVQNNSNNL